MKTYVQNLPYVQKFTSTTHRLNLRLDLLTLCRRFIPKLDGHTSASSILLTAWPNTFWHVTKIYRGSCLTWSVGHSLELLSIFIPR